MLDGPVFVDEEYELHREVVGLGESRRTESYWTETTVTERRLGQGGGDRAAAPGRVQGVLRRLPARPPDDGGLVTAMDGEIIASGLAFPEGPVWVDGTLLFTEITGGVVSRWTPGGEVEPFATTGGGPNGAALAADGSLYVTQNGGMGRRPADDAGHPARQRRTATSTMVVTEVAGLTLEGPNDLAFGDDGRLWFTDPRGADDPARNDRPGRIFAVDLGDRRRRAGRRARAGVPERHRLPRRRHARVDRVVQPPCDGDGRRARPSSSSSCPSATTPTGCASAPTVGCTWRRRTPTACSVVDGRRDRRPLRVRRRDGDELLLRRDRPLRHRVPPRHAVALPARRRRPAAARLSRRLRSATTPTREDRGERFRELDSAGPVPAGERRRRRRRHHRSARRPTAGHRGRASVRPGGGAPPPNYLVWAILDHDLLLPPARHRLDRVRRPGERQVRRRRLRRRDGLVAKGQAVRHLGGDRRRRGRRHLCSSPSPPSGS